ncbi:hypothetical protein ACFSYH_08795 [Populibacterium corticicola]|uniref:Uncharacterized protein n=1 Tax=Populibacterium corticicola TaxID=1812826 RepID=A0ABW5XDV9_9MICO
MTIDIKAMLHRIVAEVFDETFMIEQTTSSKNPWMHTVRVANPAIPERTAIICATYEWMEVFIPELKVTGTIFEYDDVEEDKGNALRPLCIAMRMYLDGEGRIEQKRRLFRRGTVPVLYLDIDGMECYLGRNCWSIPY